MTNYTNCISIEKALYFDLFDDIDYKWLKLILDPSVDREEYDFEVEIEDIPVEEVIEGFFKISPECRTTFTFDLKMAQTRPSFNANGYITEYITKTFTKTIDYDRTSAIARTLYDMKDNEDDEEEEEEENN